MTPSAPTMAICASLSWKPKGNMCNHMPTSSWGKTKVRHIFHQFVKAIQYMHQQGVLHLDIKPKNVLILAKGDALLCNFGFS
jgi:serine/threonine protein kinase